MQIIVSHCKSTIILHSYTLYSYTVYLYIVHKSHLYWYNYAYTITHEAIANQLLYYTVAHYTV